MLATAVAQVRVRLAQAAQAGSKLPGRATSAGPLSTCVDLVTSGHATHHAIRHAFMPTVRCFATEVAYKEDFKPTPTGLTVEEKHKLQLALEKAAAADSKRVEAQQIPSWRTTVNDNLTKDAAVDKYEAEVV